MTHPKIIEHEAVTMAYLKEELKKIKERDTELSFRGQKTEEYLDQISVLKQKNSEELFQKIKKMDVPRLKEEHIRKIIDVLPMNINELKMVMQGYAITVTAENLTKIQKAVEDFSPETPKTAPASA